MEAVDAVVGSRAFAAALVALWVTGSWNGEGGRIRWISTWTLKRCDGGGRCERWSPTVVLLGKLLVGVRHYFCGARLFAAEDVGVHGGAVQHQRPLLQFACSGESGVRTAGQELRSVL